MVIYVNVMYTRKRRKKENQKQMMACWSSIVALMKILSQ